MRICTGALVVAVYLNDSKDVYEALIKNNFKFVTVKYVLSNNCYLTLSDDNESEAFFCLGDEATYKSDKKVVITLSEAKEIFYKRRFQIYEEMSLLDLTKSNMISDFVAKVNT